MRIFGLILILCVFITESLTENISARNFNSECGQVFTKKQFIIESRGYPSNYPLNYQCSYLVKGPTCPTRFSFQFLDFSVEDSLGCSKDRFEIDDKDALCGNRNDVKDYFSEKGTLLLKFVSDNENTGRGYRILVTRFLCENTEPERTTQNLPKWYTTNKDIEYTTTQHPVHDRHSEKCCPTTHISKRFILVSPNFPYSMSTPMECLYEIYKNNPDICRLRIHIQFFWLGRSSNCYEGFLEIDGKQICGCKKNLKIIAPFQGQSTKIIRFVSKGYERSSYSGFVMDVIQDECPKKVVPISNPQNITGDKKIRFYNDQINKVAWPNKSHEVVLEKLHLINENTEVIVNGDVNESLGKNQKQIIRHVYFYSLPDFDRIPREREDTEYLDTSSRTSFIQGNIDYGSCRNWNQLQFNSLSLRNLSVCKNSEGSVRESHCIELNQRKGYFKSPGYPFYYPGNINICYRFYKLPGYCRIRVYMKDFDLQNSDTCDYDYLLFANQLKYCGSRLINTVSTLELRHKPHEQMSFVTDAFFCGRGFLGTYEQIPCEEFLRPTNPTDSMPPYVPPQMTPCSKTVQEKTFTFDVYDYNNPHCTLIIRKYLQDVCTVQLYFEKFDLICAFESLVVDGKMYCGRLTGQTVNIDVTNKDSVIMYKRSSNVGVNGLRLRIKGIQLSEDCPYPEVPAERIQGPGMGSLKEPENEENITQYVLKMGKNFRDICGVVINTTEANLPQTFCDLLMKNEKNITNCVPLKEDLLIVPLNESHKIELKIQNAETTEEIEFQEVECASLASN